MRTRSLWICLVLSLLLSSLLAAIGAEGPFTVNFVIDMREEIAAKRFEGSVYGQTQPEGKSW
jgi:hypothetical protein